MEFVVTSPHGCTSRPDFYVLASRALCLKALGLPGRSEVKGNRCPGKGNRCLRQWLMRVGGRNPAPSRVSVTGLTGVPGAASGHEPQLPAEGTGQSRLLSRAFFSPRLCSALCQGFLAPSPA